jgi:thymidylate synthase (FAD)
MKHEFYIPEEKDIKAQDVKNHQGSEGEVNEAAQYKFLSQLCADTSAMYIGYTNAVKDKIARETARIGLPLNVYTEMVFSVDLLNLLKFIALRNHKNAQYEIRTYASVLEDIVSALWPMTYASFKRHRKEGLSLSSDELKTLKEILSKLSQQERDALKDKEVSRNWKEKAEILGL